MEPENRPPSFASPSLDDPTDSSPASSSASPSPLSGWARAWIYGALAMELTFGVVGGGVGGFFLDRWFQTQPILTVVGLGLGFGCGLTLLLRGFKKLEESE